jgi:hypothetical protein
MAVEAAEATESLFKDTRLVGLDGPLEELDLTNMLVKKYEEEGPEESSLSGAAVEEAEPVEESTEEALRTLRTLPSSAPSGRPGYLPQRPAGVEDEQYDGGTNGSQKVNAGQVLVLSGGATAFLFQK